MGGSVRAYNQLATAAEGTENVLYPTREALSNLATVGEVSDVCGGSTGTASTLETRIARPSGRTPAFRGLTNAKMR